MANATYQPKAYREQGGDAFVVASGGELNVESGGTATVESGGALTVASGGTLTVSSGANFSMPGDMGKGFIPIDLTSARIIATNAIPAIAVASGNGGNLAADTAPILERINGATDKALRIRWAATDVAEVQFPPIALPPDLDGAQAVTVHLLVYKDANMDATASIDVQVFFGVGDTECGAATAAITETTATEKSISVAAGDVPAPPNVMNIALVPAAHNNDAIYCLAAWVEYTRITTA